MTKRRVYAAYTGGTIGMMDGPDGLEPRKKHLTRTFTKMLRDDAKAAGLPLDEILPEFEIREYPELVDSSDFTPRDWDEIARDIEAHYDDFDGFVVIQGTDTLAYSASALSYRLEHLGKPVVVTGAQNTIAAPDGDGKTNLVRALLVAGNLDRRIRLTEVMIQFGDVLLRGNRSIKIQSHDFSAFVSPNYPPLGRWHRFGIEIVPELLAPAPAVPFRPRIGGVARVGVLRIFPGMGPNTCLRAMNALVDSRCGGVIIDAFGAGNGPGTLVGAIEAATERGVIIVVCSQCAQGGTNLLAYATGSRLKRAGALDGRDLTIEAAVTKLQWLLSLGSSISEVKRQFQRDLRGEQTSGRRKARRGFSPTYHTEPGRLLEIPGRDFW